MPVKLVTIFPFECVVNSNTFLKIYESYLWKQYSVTSQNHSSVAFVDFCYKSYNLQDVVECQTNEKE